MTLMEPKRVSKPSMVSKLPKFASRPVNATSSLPNSAVHTWHTHEGKGISGKSNGVVQPSSFSVKWTKENGFSTVPLAQDISGEKREPRSVYPPGSQVNKKPATAVRKLTSSVFNGSPKPVPKSSKSISSPREKNKINQDTQFNSRYSTSPSKLMQKGTMDSSPGVRSSRLQRLRDNLSSKDGLSLSTSGLKTLSADRMVRSQSFTHFRQPSSANSTIPRSFSFNKAVELAKPLTNTQLRPLHSVGLKPPQCHGFRKSFSDRSSTAVPLSPNTGLKKPLFTNGVLNKPSVMGFSQTHSFTATTQRSLLAGRSQKEHQMIFPSCIPQSNQHAQMFKKSVADLPDGEEMSFSSANSDKNDACEDLLDELDHLCDQSNNDVPDSRHLATPTQTRLHNYLHEDWTGGAVSAFSDVDVLRGSSRSPSNSSGGTYIWDEEIIEPHSYTSTKNTHDLNTTDFVNIVNRKVFDVESNYLILDVDLPEDRVMQNGETTEDYKCSDWTKQRQSGTNHLHNNNNRLLILQDFDGYPAVQSDDHTVAIEEYSFTQMLQDCCSVKSELLKLKILLQMEDGEMNNKQGSDVNRPAMQQQHQSFSESEIKEVKLGNCQKADKSTQTPQRPSHTQTGLSPLPCSPRNSTLQHTHTSNTPAFQPTAPRGPHSGTLSKSSHHRGPQ